MLYLLVAEETLKTNQISKAKEHFLRFFEMFNFMGYEIYQFTQDQIYSKMALILTIIDDDTLISVVLNDHKNEHKKFSYYDSTLDINSFLYSLASEYIKQNKADKFFKYYKQITEESQTKQLLVEACSQQTSEKISSFVYDEAMKMKNKSIISLYYANQAKKLIMKKEYEKALQLVEKMDLYYDKATIFTLLAIHWEKPNLGGATAPIIHRIIESCNQ